ncbi:MAG TPA: hypothetical protein VHY18_07575 [Solirubrobacteraceae bacterium]|nr:hypothetical protein [Solirubrobacteraceae bacterium]
MAVVSASHIPYPLVERAIRTGNLSFIRRHAGQITLSLRDRISVWVLTAEQDPAGLEAAAADFIKWWATEVPGAQLADYRLILKACDEILAAPERVADELAALCAARGID